MSLVPDDLLYTKEHEWIKQLEDGSVYEGNAVFGVVESVKAASDLYMPIPGEVLEVNEALSDAPEQVNEDPYGEGWMIKIQPSESPNSMVLLDSLSYSSEIAE